MKIYRWEVNNEQHRCFGNCARQNKNNVDHKSSLVDIAFQ